MIDWNKVDLLKEHSILKENKLYLFSVKERDRFGNDNVYQFVGRLRNINEELFIMNEFYLMCYKANNVTHWAEYNSPEG